jgi:hypothetical protein
MEPTAGVTTGPEISGGAGMGPGGVFGPGTSFGPNKPSFGSGTPIFNPGAKGPCPGVSPFAVEEENEKESDKK